VVLIAHNQTAKLKQPGKEPLNCPAPDIAARSPPVLRRNPVVLFVGSDHFRAVDGHQFFIHLVNVLGLVPDQSLGHIGHDAFFQRCIHQIQLSYQSTCCRQGDRKPMSVRESRDLAAIAAPGLPHQAHPSLAGMNVPRTKHPLKSNPAASFRCCARSRSIRSITPERRCAVSYGRYRGGKSCQGAPVRKIHKTPLRTLRRFPHGRPVPRPVLTLPAGWFRTIYDLASRDLVS
jgi:hypothetical protein